MSLAVRWNKDIPANMKDVSGAQQLVDELVRRCPSMQALAAAAGTDGVV